MRIQVSTYPRAQRPASSCDRAPVFPGVRQSAGCSVRHSCAAKPKIARRSSELGLDICEEGTSQAQSVWLAVVFFVFLIVIFFAVVFVLFLVFLVWLLSEENLGSYRLIRKF